MSRPPSVRQWELGAQESSGADESDEPHSGIDTTSDTDDISDDEWYGEYILLSVAHKLTYCTTDDGGWPSMSHHANVVRQFRQIYEDTTGGSNMPRFELIKVDNLT